MSDSQEQAGPGPAPQEMTDTYTGDAVSTAQLPWYVQDKMEYERRKAKTDDAADQQMTDDGAPEPGNEKDPESLTTLIGRLERLIQAAVSEADYEHAAKLRELLGRAELSYAKSEKIDLEEARKRLRPESNGKLVILPPGKNVLDQSKPGEKPVENTGVSSDTKDEKTTTVVVVTKEPEKQAEPKLTSIEQVVLHPMAYLKLKAVCHLQDAEVAMFGVAGNRDQLLHITDFVLVKQEVTGATFDIDSDAVLDYMDEYSSHDLHVSQFMRVLVHTHPGSSADPSHTDEQNLKDMYGTADWNCMMIMSRTGTFYCRVTVQTPNVKVERNVPVTVAWESFGPYLKKNGQAVGKEMADWIKEFEEKVTMKSYSWGGSSTGGNFRSANGYYQGGYAHLWGDDGYGYAGPYGNQYNASTRGKGQNTPAPAAKTVKPAKAAPSQGLQDKRKNASLYLNETEMYEWSTGKLTDDEVFVIADDRATEELISEDILVRDPVTKIVYDPEKLLRGKKRKKWKNGNMTVEQALDLCVEREKNILLGVAEQLLTEEEHFDFTVKGTLHETKVIEMLRERLRMRQEAEDELSAAADEQDAADAAKADFEAGGDASDGIKPSDVDPGADSDGVSPIPNYNEKRNCCTPVGAGQDGAQLEDLRLYAQNRLPIRQLLFRMNDDQLDQFFLYAEAWSKSNPEFGHELMESYARVTDQRAASKKDSKDPEPAGIDDGNPFN